MHTSFPEQAHREGSIQRLCELSVRITETYDEYGGINRIDGENLPSRDRVIEILNDLLALLFPGYFSRRPVYRSSVSFFVNSTINSIYVRLMEEIEKALNYECAIKECEVCQQLSDQIVLHLLETIPEIRRLLRMDVQAAYDGDPAAKSNDEIMLSYPCIEAIATYRIAHELYEMKVPLIPRMMTEWAHSRTGIDIHPGAKIGERFFIDHGTGVVIGETTEIGNDVKIYQGVTLGALSFPKGPDGKVVKGGKRHPTIEDHVTIYAEATILGGQTVVGKGAVIGGNVWLTRSVPPGTRVNATTRLEYKETPKKKAST